MECTPPSDTAYKAWRGVVCPYPFLPARRQQRRLISPPSPCPPCPVGLKCHALPLPAHVAVDHAEWHVRRGCPAAGPSPWPRGLYLPSSCWWAGGVAPRGTLLAVRPGCAPQRDGMGWNEMDLVLRLESRGVALEQDIDRTPTRASPSSTAPTLTGALPRRVRADERELLLARVV